ncbi:MULTISPECIES: DUF2169 domain-containing protein [Sorangium]|uniref:DUF2169 domain-containing protein n=1 Tax=Sorangium cellulosum TaxID=56 RepID=A0A4V0NGM2_SORCE|nr:MULTISPECIES: DUF2169 domain-containing protein [Sorangium]AUX33662.1 hypothetical protein SOCE836_058230 [Sorangium cellulosum]WCQ92973.1 hypothetical protein NQZ70_05719 [Sorangium sp. Soce836]
MECQNLTPLDALAYSALDAHDEEHHVLALKAAYRLVPGGGGEATHRCELLPGDGAGRLLLRDAFEGEANASSVRAESDLAPFKPRCDVLVRATAWAPGEEPAERWTARLRVTGRGAPPPGGDAVGGEPPPRALVDKTLEVCGPRWFERAAEGWQLTRPEPAASVPVRWERAFGGRSLVSAGPGRAPLLDEVCFTNPVGCGWMEARTVDALRDAGAPAPDRVAAPQIERPDSRVTRLAVASHPPHAVDAPQMAEIAADYPFAPAGLGCVGRAWTPRLQRAGTYGEAWVAGRHPFLPDDFSFAYWNAAPDDQQIPHPDLGLRVELWNLARPGLACDGRVAFELPPHRAFAMAWIAGLPVPVPAALDTLSVDAESMVVTCVWRALVARALGVQRMEARFEVDPRAPLLKMAVGRG